jgi:predicted ATPase
MLEKMRVQNFRSLANVIVKIEPLNILFGPNGAGKSTFLDAIWFLRDCVINGVDEASSYRSHGIGALWDGADEGANINIKLETETAKYEILFGYSSGRIEPLVGETLDSKDLNIRLIDRKIGSDKATFYHNKMNRGE